MVTKNLLMLFSIFISFFILALYVNKTTIKNVHIVHRHEFILMAMNKNEGSNKYADKEVK